MKRVIISGANRGIGLALVEHVLGAADDHAVWLGARSPERGQAAVDGLRAKNAAWAERLEVLALDVADGASVEAAATTVRAVLGEGETLYGLVNNAGIGYPDSALRDTLEVNIYGTKRVTDAFLPLMQPSGGRIVNITSASGPNFVEKCSSEQQQILTSPDVTWEQIETLLQQCLGAKGNAGEFARLGLGDGSSYGISKACGNAYTLSLAREYPELVINACTPGFIETELTRPIAERYGKTPAEMGMKSPEEGTVSAMHLLFGDVTQSGHYYGSDALRSPMHCYRSPGTPAYTGD